MPRSPAILATAGPRLAALASLLLAGLALATLVLFTVRHLEAVLVGAVGLGLLLSSGWRALVTRGGRTRWVAAALAAAGALILGGALVRAVGSVERAGVRFAALVLVAAAALWIGRWAMRREIEAAGPPGWRRVEPPRQPVLFCNPRSGGGKAEAFAIQDRARDLGVEVVVLGPDDDLRALALAAVEQGADCLGTAGGDGTLALVAAVAIDHDLPFVCIPVGTRNHLAQDLALDRSDPPAALAAFAHGVERRIDVGRLDDRVFLNNVSFGIYGELVRDERYRDDKLGTTLDLLGEITERGGHPYDLHVRSPEGEEIHGAFLIQVSNNPYEIGRVLDFGQRLRLDAGVLGVVMVRGDRGVDVAGLVALAAANQLARSPSVESWEVATLEVDTGDSRVWVGIDGEAVEVDSPVRMRTHPRALRVLVPPDNPAAAERRRSRQVSLGHLVGVALGR